MLRKQKRMYVHLSCHAIIIMVISMSAITITNAGMNKVEVVKYDISVPTADTASNIKTDSCIPNNIEVQKIEKHAIPFYGDNWSEEDKYMLAKIAMCEAEGQSKKTKRLVVMAVLNRVLSKQFPNTVEEVIKQKVSGVYQFSPVIDGGRWYTVEPNQECYDAVEKVLKYESDHSDGATYFESCQNEDNWHSRHLEFLYQSDDMRFYK